MRQVVAGVGHLHRLGVLHRDLRAANVLVASLDPIEVMLADLGVAHLLSAFATGSAGVSITASKVTTLLTGDAATGPLLWMAPEVLTGECSALCPMRASLSVRISMASPLLHTHKPHAASYGTSKEHNARPS